MGTTCIPVDTMLTQLEDTCQHQYTETIAIRQLLEVYKKSGLNVTVQGADVQDN